MQLHYDNLVALAEKEPALEPLPSYSTLVRYMKARDLIRRVRRGPPASAGADLALHRLQTREVRSWEVEYVNQLWAFGLPHQQEAARPPRARTVGVPGVRLRARRSLTPVLPRPQWYLEETAETFVHSLGQAFLKRGLSRRLHERQRASPCSPPRAAVVSPPSAWCTTRPCRIRPIRTASRNPSGGSSKDA
jgi:hypothetical protein